MRIRMLKTVRGAEDGFTVREYLIDTEHELSGTARAQELAEVFLREGWAEEVGKAPAEAPAPHHEPQIHRLPPLDEYVASGYDPAGYDAFIAAHHAEAEAAGDLVVIEAAPAAPPVPAAPAEPAKAKKKGR
jgi:hypothetical protein